MFVFRMHAVARDVFDTTGAVLYPGRWHTAGARVVYAAEHASLAALETLIHAGGRRIPARSVTRIEIPDDLPIESAAWLELPDSRIFGDRWALERRSVILRVPSIAVNKMESNFILNPAHQDFGRLRRDPSQIFAFDPRYFAL